ncbi:iron chaperone [Microbacterium sp. gxy059]|uniref:iron chaperone n=1 Tax=Microbacterium sp. gxy059 TaxID=2957199 RepID=UPI003D95D92D
MSETKSGFSAEERAAMAQRADELRATRGVKGAAKRAKELEACLAAIEALEGADRAIAERLHVIVSEEAPDLDAKTWYGFPTYHRDGENIVFYQPASKFGTRYGTVSFDEHAALDDGPMWPVSYAVAEVTDAVESRLRDLVRRAIA